LFSCPFPFAHVLSVLLRKRVRIVKLAKIILWRKKILTTVVKKEKGKKTSNKT
jgi:hypothetical protein